MDELEREIVDALAEKSGLSRSEIEAAPDLYSLGIDSLSALEMLAALEKKYDVTIPDHELRNVNSIDKIVKLILDELKKRSR